jgi:hypothetical protein
MNSKDPIRPPASYYWFAAPFPVIGIGLFPFTLFHGIFHITDGLMQVVVPGTAELLLKKDLYTVFLEKQSVVDGKIYSTQDPVDALACSAKSKSTGEMTNMRRASSSITYNLGSRSGRSVLAFDAPEDGVYEFECKYSEDRKGPETVVAVGTGVGERILKMLLTCLGAMFGGVAVAICVFLVVLLLRKRAKKLLGGPVLPLG